uniref:Metacaspase n=1 Tax=Margalefidinium polykrikoides TaxID=77300 RepID=A0A2L1FDS3_9DINO|nr:metacaspase [Margalefidinium polykrikoides]
MVKCGSKVYASTDIDVDAADNCCEDNGGDIYMICAGIDYSCDRTWAGKHPLDTRPAWEMRQDLGRRCSANVYPIFNQQSTIDGVTSMIEQVGAKVGPDDWFIFYYTGHGDQLADDDNEEANGKDSAFCLLGPDRNTEPRQEVWLRDDDFAKAITENVTRDAKILVLADCCHSGTIMDLNRPCWDEGDFRALSISGCTDKQTSAGTGKGGMFSRALTKAIQDCCQELEEGYSVGEVYNRTLQKYQEYKQPGHTQSITINCSGGLMPKDLKLPLAPDEGYVTKANTTLRGINVTK